MRDLNGNGGEKRVPQGPLNMLGSETWGLTPDRFDPVSIWSHSSLFGFTVAHVILPKVLEFNTCLESELCTPRCEVGAATLQ